MKRLRLQYAAIITIGHLSKSHLVWIFIKIGKLSIQDDYRGCGPCGHKFFTRMKK